MADPARRKATYADLEALAPNLVGEILFGVLHAFPRPRTRHARASRLGGRLGPPFDEGNDGWSADGCVTVGAWRGEDRVRAEPFDAIELPLAVLWAR